MQQDATQQIFKCFVVMPFSATEHTLNGRTIQVSEEQWTHVYTHWIKKAVESFGPYKFRCFRSPAQPGNFVRGIVRDLFDADIVIADLTGCKANVYYELGIRHGLETGTIMITQDLAGVPSDLKGYYTFQYRYSSEHHEYDRYYQEFERDLHEKMQYIFDNLNPSDNPVSDFLGRPNEHLRQSFEEEKNELVFIAELFRQVARRNFDLCVALQKLAKTEEAPEDGPALIFDFFPFDLLLSRLVNTRWHVMPMQILQSLNDALHSIRLLFLPVHQGWEIMCINPTSEANRHFFDLVDAVVESRAKNEDELLGAIVEATKKLDFSVSYKPRATTLDKK